MTARKVYTGSDHAGFELRGGWSRTCARVRGPRSRDALRRIDRLPGLGGRRRTRGARSSRERAGVLVCGTGLGVCIAANKIHGVRAADVWNVETARLSRAHNDANVLCVGARMVARGRGARDRRRLAGTTPFEGGRHENASRRSPRWRSEEAERPGFGRRAPRATGSEQDSDKMRQATRPHSTGPTTLGQSIWYDNMRRGSCCVRRARGSDRARRARDHVEPDHLREGDRPLDRLRGRAAQAGRRGALDDRDLRGARLRGHPRRLRPDAAASTTRAASSTAASRWRCSPSSPPRPTEPSPRGSGWPRPVDRPNVMIKVPATPEGIPAIRALTAHGISVNVTLVFSLLQYEEVIEAYLSGLEERKARRRLVRRAHLGGELLRVARRHRLRQAADRQDGHGRADEQRPLRGPAGQAGDRQRQAGLRDLPAHDRLAALARSWPRPAPTRSACSGRRPGPRTRATPTPTTSTR